MRNGSVLVEVFEVAILMVNEIEIPGNTERGNMKAYVRITQNVFRKA